MKKKTPIKKPQYTIPVQSNEEIMNEIKAVRDVIEIKKGQSNTEISQEQIDKLVESSELSVESKEPAENIDNSNGGVNGENLETPIETSEPITQPKKKLSLFDDFQNTVTQEDLNKKPETNGEHAEAEPKKTSFESRLEDASEDDFPTNEGASEEEDTPEYRREMAKIKASALVEFFDVVFMLICLGISKDFSDNAQIKFSLIKPRKNAIKANIFQIMAFSKKKHNPTGTVIFLILFSYVPLIAIAIMERVRNKKAEQEKIKEQENKAFTPPQIIYRNNPEPSENNSFTDKQMPKKVRKSNKVVTVHEQSGAKVKQMANGDFKNLETGQVYKGGRGRKPSWLKQYIGKIG